VCSPRPLACRTTMALAGPVEDGARQGLADRAGSGSPAPRSTALPATPGRPTSAGRPRRRSRMESGRSMADAGRRHFLCKVRAAARPYSTPRAARIGIGPTRPPGRSRPRRGGVAVAPTVAPHFEARIGHELDCPLGVGAHPEPAGEKGGTDVELSQDPDHLGVVPAGPSVC